jgi:ATP-dependent RNA helicase RhlE
MQIDETFAKLAEGTESAPPWWLSMDEGRQLRSIRRGAQVMIRLRPAGCATFCSANWSTSETRKPSCSTKPTACWTWLPAVDPPLLMALPSSRQTLLFSATMEKSVAHIIAGHVHNPVRVAIGTITKPVEQVDLHLYEVEQNRKLSLLARLMRDEEGSFLVFTRTRHGADRVARNLGRFGFKAARIHGDRTQGQRNQALNGFKDGEYRVLVATDVAARGIHVDNIAQVVNYDLPQVPEDFIHRGGRTAARARAGRLPHSPRRASAGKSRESNAS